jgi:hypothetical protein
VTCLLKVLFLCDVFLHVPILCFAFFSEKPISVLMTKINVHSFIDVLCRIWVAGFDDICVGETYDDTVFQPLSLPNVIGAMVEKLSQLFPTL